MLIGPEGINRTTWKLVVSCAVLVFAIVFLVAVGLVTYQRSSDNHLRDAQVRACKQLGNPRARQITRNGKVLGELLVIATEARLDSARLESGVQARNDRKTARRYRSLARQLSPVPIADCEAIYPKP